MPRQPQQPDHDPADRRQRVQAAETGMAVLKGLARLGGRATLSALAAHVAENPAKVHRYLASLVEEGLVAQDGETQQYYLGAQAIQIGLAAMRQVDPIRAAGQALVRLRENLGVTCFLSVMGNLGPTIMRFEEPGLPVTVNVRAGSVMPLLWSATGRVFLGLLDEARVTDMARTELASATAAMRALLPSKDPVEAIQAEVRQAGCAVVADTYLRGISAVAAPIRDFNGRVCGTLCALGATGGFDVALDGVAASAVRAEAAATSLRLGATA